MGKSNSETTSASAPCSRTTGMNAFLSTSLGNRSRAVPVGGCLSRQTVVEPPGRRSNDRHTFGRARFGGRSAGVAGGDHSDGHCFAVTEFAQAAGIVGFDSPSKVIVRI